MRIRRNAVAAGHRPGPAPTGRTLVLLHGRTASAGVALLRDAAGLRVAVSSDFDAARLGIEPGEGLLFERLGAALLCGDPDQTRALLRQQREGTLLLEPERRVRASVIGDADPDLGTPLADTPAATWGLLATRVPYSPYQGRGIRVAILDTGLDLFHPDFADRAVVSTSFAGELPVDDGNGHGTLCAGIACGPRQPALAPRYGVAPAAELYVARILDDDADGTDGSVLAGIDWAVRHRCAVVSLSVGAPVAAGDSYPMIYEHAAARALDAGTVLIAPAGNSSQRPDTILPVEHPANCPSILAVAAVDQNLAVASFSNGGVNPDGGAVDLAAPGIAIASASPRPALYQSGSGTSMAAPFVAGIAALIAEADPRARGAALRAALLKAFRPLPAPARDVGAGLVQAPQ
ncbi:MAG TPA: S8 family serine peptidase [Steroidobacteraceae bacterium]|nr:S8 family serine peptidase [Steroidobacteraceae bacterium]